MPKIYAIIGAVLFVLMVFFSGALYGINISNAKQYKEQTEIQAQEILNLNKKATQIQEQSVILNKKNMELENENKEYKQQVDEINPNNFLHDDNFTVYFMCKYNQALQLPESVTKATCGVNATSTRVTANQILINTKEISTLYYQCANKVKAFQRYVNTIIESE